VKFIKMKRWQVRPSLYMAASGWDPKVNATPH
jgi:hypothetical protein